MIAISNQDQGLKLKRKLKDAVHADSAKVVPEIEVEVENKLILDFDIPFTGYAVANVNVEKQCLCGSRS